jgi:hypothetical protein
MGQAGVDTEPAETTGLSDKAPDSRTPLAPLFITPESTRDRLD